MNLQTDVVAPDETVTVPFPSPQRNRKRGQETPASEEHVVDGPR